MTSHKDFSNITLFTGRLQLSSVRIEDTPTIFKEFRGVVVEYQDVFPAKTLDEQQRWVEEGIADAKAGKALLLVISDKNTGEFFGRCALKKVHTSTPELGIWLKQSAHGKGYAEESVRCALAWASEHLQYEYIKAFIQTANARSIHLIEKLGGLRIRQFTMKNTARGDLQVYEYKLPV